MRKKCKGTLTIFFLLGFFPGIVSINAQIGQITDRPAKSYVPAAPNAAQFQKYGDIPVDYSAGVPSISLPIWTLKLKDFSWPISLSYHSIGIQVSEVSSNVGLGWTLNAGGIISAKVIGENDFTRNNWGNSIRRNLITGGYMGYSGVCVNYNDTDQQYAELLSQPYENTLPDIYYLNTPVANGKFFLRDDIGYCMPRSNLKINYNRHSSGNVAQSSFTVIDQNGNKYFFEKVGGNTTFNNCTEGPQISVPNTSFYLTKINTYSGEEIFFYYTVESFSYSMPGSETSYERLSLNCSECTGNFIQPNTCTPNFAASEQRLDKITTSTGENISFYYSARNDLPGSSKLDRIEIGFQNEAGTMVKYKRTFVNSYFESGPQPTGLRLRLDELYSSSIQVSAIEKHKFTYNTVSLPDRLSFAVDFFGYYNGQTTNVSFLLPNANRTPDPAFSKAGILTKIEYPTGGYTEFNYEYNYRFGGNRILKIEDIENGNISKTRTFQYLPQNIPNYQPSFTESLTKYYVKPGQDFPPVFCNGVGINGTCYNTYFCAYVKHSSSPSSSIYEQFMTHKKFDLVSEYLGLNGEGGLTEYIYDYPKTPSGAYKLTDLANIEAQLTHKKVYKKSPTGYSILSEEILTYQVLEDQLNYFNDATDSREKNTWGLEVILERQQLSGVCNFPGSPPASQNYCYPATYLQGNFKLVSTPLFLKSNQSITYNYTNSGAQQSISQTVTYSYDDLAHCLPTKTTSTQSNTKQVITEVKYPTSYSSFPGLTTDETNALSSLVSTNNIAAPFYAESRINGVVSTKAFSSYKLNGAKAYQSKLLKYPTGTSAFIQTEYAQPDTKNNIREIISPDGIATSILYDEKTNDVLAQVSGAKFSDVAYSSFEGQGLGGWTMHPGSTIMNSGGITGSRSFSGVLLRTITSPGKYIVTIWGYRYGTQTVNGQQGQVLRTIDSWALKQWVLNNPSSIEIAADAMDEVRLYPQGAQMNTYTYDAQVGITGTCDPNNRITYYDYDEFGRLVLVRDDNNNIIKKICYNLAGQAENCNIFFNDPISQSFTRNDCPWGYTGTSISYSISKRKYLSTISQTDANAKAFAEGQAYANANCTCIVQ